MNVDPDWGAELPDLTAQDVSDTTVGPDDTVYLLYRAPSFVQAATPEGKPLRRIGEGLLGPRAHGVTVRADGSVLVVDSGAHTVLHFDAAGELVGRFGEGPANPAFAPGRATGNYYEHVDRAYPPMTLPTRLAVEASGDLLLSDGYGNCCVHRYTPDGTLKHSWGAPGTGPGEFHTPHHVTVDAAGRILVCDRENDRIQVFGADGGFLAEWTDLRRPQAVAQGGDGRFYVAEGMWRRGHVSPVHGPVGPAKSRISVLAGDGAVVDRFGGDRPGTPGSFIAAHAIAVDSRGDVYVAEVAHSVSRQLPELGAVGCVTVQKVVRQGTG